MDKLICNLILVPVNENSYVDEEGFLYENDGDAVVTGADEKNDYDVHACQAWNQMPNAPDPRLERSREAMAEYEKMVENHPEVQEIADIWLRSQYFNENVATFGSKIEAFYGWNSNSNKKIRARRISKLVHEIEDFVKGDGESFQNTGEMFFKVTPSTALLINIVKDLRIFVNDVICGENSRTYHSHKYVTDGYASASEGYICYRNKEYYLHSDFYGNIWWDQEK